jgi:phosphatidylinositol alpha-mannosyltransferase
VEAWGLRFGEIATRMKIALVVPYDLAYPGGVASHVANLYHQLVVMGHDVRVIGPASNEVSIFGSRFIPIGKPRPFPASDSISRVPISLNLGGEIKAVLAAEKFDIVHLHEPFVPMLCSAVLRFSDAVNIGTFHAAEGAPGYNFGWPFGRMILRRRRRKLHGRIAVSLPAKKFASKYVPGDFTIIPNGVDFSHFPSQTAPMPPYDDGRPNILFLGRIEKRKGLECLLHAYRQLKTDIPEARLLVVGGGTRLRKRYERWIERHRIEDVVFTGRVSDADRARYFRTATVYCSPATGKESFGVVLIEAMASGVPIVASNIEGYAGVLTDGQEGLLVPPRNAARLAEALGTILRDKAMQRAMGERGLSTARNYSWDKVARRVVDYYQAVLRELKERRVISGIPEPGGGGRVD